MVSLDSIPLAGGLGSEKGPHPGAPLVARRQFSQRSAPSVRQPKDSNAPPKGFNKKLDRFLFVARKAPGINKSQIANQLSQKFYSVLARMIGGCCLPKNIPFRVFSPLPEKLFSCPESAQGRQPPSTPPPIRESQRVVFQPIYPCVKKMQGKGWVRKWYLKERHGIKGRRGRGHLLPLLEP